MPLGRRIRSLLGDRHARVVGRAYRSLFVDMTQATSAIAAQIPSRAHVLDVGGGDGEPLNHLLDQRADIRVSTIDLAPSVGEWIAPAHLARVERLPATRLQDYETSGRPLPDVLLLSDVMHHVPVGERDALLRCAARLWDRRPTLRIIVKDVEPGHLRSVLGYLSDRYVTGDRFVSLVSRHELKASMGRACPALHCFETALYALDKPNYALVFAA